MLRVLPATFDALRGFSATLAPSPALSTPANGAVGSSPSIHVPSFSAAEPSRPAASRPHAHASSELMAIRSDIWSELDHRSPEPSIRRADKGKTMGKGLSATTSAPRSHVWPQTQIEHGDERVERSSSESYEEETSHVLAQDNPALPFVDPSQLGDSEWPQKLHAIVRKQHKDVMHEYERAKTLARAAVIEATLAKSVLKDEMEKFECLLDTISSSLGSQYANYLRYHTRSGEEFREPTLGPQPMPVRQDPSSSIPPPLSPPTLRKQLNVEAFHNDDALTRASSSASRISKRTADGFPCGSDRLQKRARMSGPASFTLAGQPLDHAGLGTSHRLKTTFNDKSPPSNAGLSLRRDSPLPRSSPDLASSDYNNEKDPPSELPVASDDVVFDTNNSRALDPVDVLYSLSPWMNGRQPEVDQENTLRGSVDDAALWMAFEPTDVSVPTSDLLVPPAASDEPVAENLRTASLSSFMRGTSKSHSEDPRPTTARHRRPHQTRADARSPPVPYPVAQAFVSLCACPRCG